MFLIRGLVFTHEAVRDWEARLAPRLAEGLRQRRAIHVQRVAALRDLISVA
jgi:transposase-like protein